MDSMMVDLDLTERDMQALPVNYTRSYAHRRPEPFILSPRIDPTLRLSF